MTADFTIIPLCLSVIASTVSFGFSQWPDSSINQHMTASRVYR